jgi:hypothetical protein
MSLFGKVRVLVGALVHKPFRSPPEKIDVDVDQGPEELEQAERPVKAGAANLTHQERVADLIARQQRDGG